MISPKIADPMVPPGDNVMLNGKMLWNRIFRKWLYGLTPTVENELAFHQKSKSLFSVKNSCEQIGRAIYNAQKHSLTPKTRGAILKNVLGGEQTYEHTLESVGLVSSFRVRILSHSD